LRDEEVFIRDNQRNLRLVSSMTSERTISLRETYILATVGLPVLIIYTVAQAGVGLLFAARHPHLRLVLEPHLLLLGLILHVQWRRVALGFQLNGLPRPRWVAAADAVSFVTTFWALGGLVQGFLHEAGLV